MIFSIILNHEWYQLGFHKHYQPAPILDMNVSASSTRCLATNPDCSQQCNSSQLVLDLTDTPISTAWRYHTTILSLHPYWMSNTFPVIHKRYNLANHILSTHRLDMSERHFPDAYFLGIMFSGTRCSTTPPPPTPTPIQPEPPPPLHHAGKIKQKSGRPELEYSPSWCMCLLHRLQHQIIKIYCPLPNFHGGRQIDPAGPLYRWGHFQPAIYHTRIVTTLTRHVLATHSNASYKCRPW